MLIFNNKTHLSITAIKIKSSISRYTVALTVSSSFWPELTIFKTGVFFLSALRESKTWGLFCCLYWPMVQFLREKGLSVRWLWLKGTLSSVSQAVDTLIWSPKSLHYPHIFAPYAVRERMSERTSKEAANKTNMRLVTLLVSAMQTDSGEKLHYW